MALSLSELEHMSPLRLISVFMREAHVMEDRNYRQDTAQMEAEFESHAQVVAHTLAQLSTGTGLSMDAVRQAMKAEEGEMFMHYPSAAGPTQYALAAHANGVQGWQPGLDF